VVGLARTHPVFTQQKTVQTVEFRQNVSVSGKRKKGARHLNVYTTLCEILCTDGERYSVAAGVQGGLIETNTRLADTPSLLSDRVRDRRDAVLCSLCFAADNSLLTCKALDFVIGRFLKSFWRITLSKMSGKSASCRAY